MTWTPPPELTQSVPRKIRIKIKIKWFIILATACALFFDFCGLVLTYEGSSLFQAMNTPPAKAGGVFMGNISGLLFFINGIYALALMEAVSGYFKEKRLYQSGSIAEATITDEKRILPGRGSSGATILSYTFKDKYGHPIEGRSLRPGIRSLDNRHPEILEKALKYRTVVYDPYDSSTSTLYPPLRIEFENS